MRKKTAIFLAAVMAISLIGCGNTEDSTGADNNSTEDSTGENQSSSEADGFGDLSIAVQLNGHSIPLYMAEKEGLFEENGFDNVEMIFFTDGSTENEALGSDQWQIGGLGNMACIAGGVAYNSHVIAAICDESNICDAWVRPDSDIAKTSGAIDGYENVLGNADQVRGKTILVPTATGAHYTIGKYLELLGLTLDDVEVISMDVAKCYTAFMAGQGDIMCIWAPSSYSAEESGLVRAFTSGDLGLTVPSYIVASEKAMQQPEKVAAAMKAVFDIIEKYDNDAELQGPIVQEMFTENGTDTDLETSVRYCSERPLYTLEQNIEFYKGEYGSRPIDEFLGDVIQFMVDQGVYTEEEKQKLDDNGFIDGTIIEMLAGEE